MQHDYSQMHKPFLRHRKEREKQFYTVLFLDDYYYDNKDKVNDIVTPELPRLKKYIFDTDTNTAEVQWVATTDDEFPMVRIYHYFKSPLTIEMWDNTGIPILSAPLVNYGVDAITIGSVIISNITEMSFDLTFTKETETPYYGKKFKLAVKTVPTFDMNNENSNDVKTVSKHLSALVNAKQPGLAIVFKRQRLESYLDLLVELDETYIHSQDTSENIRYLVRRGGIDDIRWTTLYTDDISDVLNIIDTEIYDVKYSWSDNGLD